MKKINILSSFVIFIFIIILSFGCKSKIENIPMGYRFLGYFYQNYDLALFKEKYNKVPFENLQITTNLTNAPADVYFYKDKIEGSVYYELVVFVFVDNKLSTWGRLSDLKVHNDNHVITFLVNVNRAISKLRINYKWSISYTLVWLGNWRKLYVVRFRK